MDQKDTGADTAHELKEAFVNRGMLQDMLYQHALRARTEHIDRFHSDISDSGIHMWVLEFSLQFSCAVCKAPLFTFAWADTRGFVGDNVPLTEIEVYKAAPRMLRVLEGIKGLEGESLKLVEDVIREAKGLEDWETPSNPPSDKIRSAHQEKRASKDRFFASMFLTKSPEFEPKLRS